ncbi:flagellar motor switch protein FliN [Alteriqipengyuania lutimaris]|uniref:Flagellar motor switch protein FliN n=1 Tax=Alteriqipengyuania lutimaris TaxID=1538146 RepID=A0A395LQV6_9SPHN|nr:flagellar motor switch protein FliN [Alteriqipengyuania lutimaris]MBB3034000.1 flagellar motor switch protein FliN/FliY [Alteriqipengyuania lutimaris]RDS77050.1 flagellar motor switch protein FliN [Alteriqipengyuania lutimaris]
MTMPFDGYGLIQEIDVRLTVELGRKNLPLREILALGENSVVELERLTDEPLDIMVNGRLIARGEVVAQGNRFAIRILELVGSGTNAGAPHGTPQVAQGHQGQGHAPVEERRAPPPTVEQI